jgi:hypothetical protein
MTMDGSRSNQIQHWFQSTWGIWLGLAVLLPLGFGGWAVITLMRLPDPMNCHTARTSDSGTARFYCAQSTAQNGSVESLQRAIQMMTFLPASHPLRPEGDRLMEQWSMQILKVAEGEFQAGNLEKALQIARRIPGRAPSAQVANETMTAWQTLWEDAEAIYNETKDAMRRERWQEALAEVKQLARIENRYWASTQYMALLNEIQAEREASELLAKQEEERKARRRDRPQSRTSEDMMTQWEQDRAAADASRLQRARALANQGTLEDLQAAISEARGVVWGTEQYEEAQALIQTWQVQVEQATDQPHLDRAVAIANQGDIESLRAAIQEARRIPSYRVLYDEAQAQIAVWTAEIEQLTAQQMANEPVDSGEALYPIPNPAPLPNPASTPYPEVPSATQLFSPVPGEDQGSEDGAP